MNSAAALTVHEYAEMHLRIRGSLTTIMQRPYYAVCICCAYWFHDKVFRTTHLINHHANKWWRVKELNLLRFRVPPLRTPQLFAMLLPIFDPYET